MAVDAKGSIIGFLMLSVKTGYRFLQKHPFIAGVLLVFFLLYLFIPSVFIVLIWSFSIIVCTYVFIRVYQRWKVQKSGKDGKKDDGLLSGKGDNTVNGRDHHVVRSQRSVRRNVRLESKEWPAPDSNKENQMAAFSVSSNVDLIGKTVMEGEKTKGVAEGKGNSMEHGESSANVQALAKPSKLGILLSSSFDGQSEKSNGGGSELLEEENSDDSEDEDEEEVHQDGAKAVEWTEDDQKNLMDLGDSEIERNRRLESLIAKRRARKLFKMQVEKSLIDSDITPPGQIAPLIIPRTNPFDVPSNPDDQVPGSAPSILLPTRNPFDLPYDPMEEKPNLSGDSFQQEFMAANQKEMLYCRHESFTYGYPFFEPRQEQYGQGCIRHRRQSEKGDHDQLVDHLLSHGRKPVFSAVSGTDCQGTSKVTNIYKVDSGTGTGKGKEVEDSHDMKSSLDGGNCIRMVNNSIEDNNGVLSPSFSLEDNERTFNANRADVSANLQPPQDKFHFKNSLFCPIPKNTTVFERSYDSSPSPIDKIRMDGRSYYVDKGGIHTPTQSIASDLVVEVSEVGSPPLTPDITSSSSEAGSLTYDGDVEKDIPSRVEEIWGASSHLYGIEENESRTNEVKEVSVEDVIEAGFSGFNQKTEDEISLSIESEQETEQDLFNARSLSSSRAEITEKSQSNSMDLANMISNDVKHVAELVGVQRSFNSSDALSPENPLKAMHLTKESMVNTPHGVHFEMTEVPSSSPDKSKELNISYNAASAVVHTNCGMEDLKSIEDRDDKAKKLNSQEVLGDLPKPAEERNWESSDHIGSSLQKSAEHLANAKSEKQMKENSKSKSIKDKGGDIEKLAKGNDIENMLKSANVKDKKLIQDSEDVQSIQEVGGSGQVQSSIVDATSGVQSELEVDQSFINSSASSSPNSVLQDTFPMNQISASNFNQQTHINGTPFDVEYRVETFSSNEQLPQNQTLSPTQYEQHLVESPTNYTYSNVTRSQEPSITLGRSAEEGNILYNANESMFDVKEAKEGLNSMRTAKVDSQMSNSQETAAELSNLAESGITIGISKLEEQNANSNAHLAEERGISKNLTENDIKIGASNESVFDNKEAKENLKSMGGIEVDSQMSSSQEAAAELSNLAESVIKIATSKLEEQNANSNAYLAEERGVSKNLTQNDIKIGTSKSEEQNAMGATEVDSQMSNSQEAAAELSNLAESVIKIATSKPEEQNANANAHLAEERGISKNLTENDTKIGTSKPEEQNTNANAPGTMANEKEPTNPPDRFTEKDSSIDVIKDPVSSEKEDKENLRPVEGSENKSQVSIGQEVMVEPTSKSIKEEEDSGPSKDTEGLGKPSAHEDIKKLPNQTDTQGNSEVIKDGQGEHENLKEHETARTPSKQTACEDIKQLPNQTDAQGNLEAIKNGQGEHENSKEHEAASTPSKQTAHEDIKQLPNQTDTQGNLKFIKGDPCEHENLKEHEAASTPSDQTAHEDIKQLPNQADAQGDLKVAKDGPGKLENLKEREAATASTPSKQTAHEDIKQLPNQTDAQGNLKVIKGGPGEHENLKEHEAKSTPSEKTAKSEQKSTAEVDTANESVAREMSKENSHAGDIVGEPSKLNKSEAISEPSKATEVDSSSKTEDTEGKFKKLTKDEANVGPSNSTWENTNSNHIKFMEHPEKDANAPKLGEVKESLQTIGDIKNMNANNIEMDKMTSSTSVVESSEAAQIKDKAPNSKANVGNREAA